MGRSPEAVEVDEATELQTVRGALLVLVIDVKEHEVAPRLVLPSHQEGVVATVARAVGRLLRDFTEGRSPPADLAFPVGLHLNRGVVADVEESMLQVRPLVRVGGRRRRHGRRAGSWVLVLVRFVTDGRIPGERFQTVVEAVAWGCILAPEDAGGSR